MTSHQDKLDRIRAAEGQHPAPEADDNPWPPTYDKATVGWALACIAVLLAIILCAISQYSGGAA